MARPKLELIGQLRHSESEGLQFPLTLGKKRKARTVWMEVLPNARHCPGVEKGADREAYLRSLHADPTYRQAVAEFLELQRREPQVVLFLFWAYKGGVYSVKSEEPGGNVSPEMAQLLVKHHVLREERSYDRIRREVEALENFERLENAPREPIPENVRLFVWQRDNGQCVQCGLRERLEFDHIIPVIAGGSSTERNIQLLCESCNRSKGARI